MTRSASRSIGVSLALLLVATAGPAAQDRANARAAGDKSTSRRHLPLAPGAVWTYDFRRAPDGEPMVYRLEAVRELEANGQRIWELRRQQHRHAGWEYWGHRRDGIHRYDNRYLGGMRGVDARRFTRFLATPVGAEPTWTWSAIQPVQTSGDVEVDPEDYRVDYVAKIESFADPVSVPAGDYEAVKVVIDADSRTFGKSSQTWWFARDVGIVKRVDAGRHATYTYALKEYRPGVRAPSVEPEKVLRAALPESARTASVERVLTGTVRRWFGSAFFRVGDAGTRGAFLMRVSGEGAQRFDPRALADWQKLLADEALVVDPDAGAGGRQLCMELPRAWAQLIGALRGRAGRPGGNSMESKPGSGAATGKAHIRGELASGDGWEESVAMRFAGGKLVELNCR